MKLVIANKCYSSWSMRPWLLMREFAIGFEEILVPFGPSFDDPGWKREVLAYTPAGKVPALIDGEVTVWDSLAIAEYLADLRSDLAIWPRDRAARAMARSISAEMHSGFQALRGACPMNLGRVFAEKERGAAVAADVARILTLWRQARERFGEGGPFLFGAFSAADAMFAPVTARLTGYSIPLDAGARAYVEAVQGTESYRAWRDAALAEPWLVTGDEADEPVLTEFRPQIATGSAR